MSKHNSIEHFIQKAKKVHDNKYDYSLMSYVNSRTKIQIRCPKHGPFYQTPDNHLNRKTRCPKCVDKHRPTTKEFIVQARKIHGDLYDYSKVNYTKVCNCITIICKLHGEFKQTPDNHLHKKNKCPNCANNRRLTTKEFIVQARKLHGDLYDYSKVNYTKTCNYVTIICKLHGEFKQTPNNHLSNKSKCPMCIQTGYSKAAIDWLTHISDTQQILIQHATNAGEFKIPNTKWRSDGYCKESNTIYEFYGDRWHGNPSIFNPTDLCHPRSNKTAAELYTATTKREDKIKELGYNLITMWESDWDNYNKNNKGEQHGKEKETRK